MEVGTVFSVFLIATQVAVSVGIPIPEAKPDLEFDVSKSFLPGPEYPLEYQPFFTESTNGLYVLRHRYLMKFQLKCILMGHSCDLIGRWLKPRVEQIILQDKCDTCTPLQFERVKKWAMMFIDKYPDLFRAAVAKYIENLGVVLPADEKIKMERLLGEI